MNEYEAQVLRDRVIVDSTAEIRERHEGKPFRIVMSWADEYAIAHKDRGILLDRLEEAEQQLRDIGEFCLSVYGLGVLNVDERVLEILNRSNDNETI